MLCSLYSVDKSLKKPIENVYMKVSHTFSSNLFKNMLRSLMRLLAYKKLKFVWFGCIVRSLGYEVVVLGSCFISRMIG
jgi:hypothetical protein